MRLAINSFRPIRSTNIGSIASRSNRDLNCDGLRIAESSCPSWLTIDEGRFFGPASQNQTVPPTSPHRYSTLSSTVVNTIVFTVSVNTIGRDLKVKHVALHIGIDQARGTCNRSFQRSV